MGIEDFEEYLNLPERDFLQATLEDAEELVEFFVQIMNHVKSDETIADQSFGVYPAKWRYKSRGSAVQIGPKPGINLDLWTKANRRWASQVLARWEEICKATMPGRQYQIAWKETKGIDEWAEGTVIVIMMFFDGEIEPDFSLGFPDSPEPLTEEERQGLLLMGY